VSPGYRTLTRERPSRSAWPGWFTLGRVHVHQTISPEAWRDYRRGEGGPPASRPRGGITLTGSSVGVDGAVTPWATEELFVEGVV
jgi:hypothetical protein